MDDMINRHDSIAEENIEPNGRPAKNEFEEWSTEIMYSKVIRKTVPSRIVRNE
jgi:hypothetical protein